MPLHQVVADRDHEVRFLEGLRDMVARAEPRRVQALGVSIRDRALAHEGHSYVDSGRLDEAEELHRYAGAHTAVAGQDHWCARAGDQIQRSQNRLVVRDRPANLEARDDGTLVHLVLGDVFRQLDVDSTWLLGAGDLEGLAHDFGDVPLVVDRCRPLRHGLEHLHRVHDLMGLLVQTGGGALARDHDDR